MSRTLFDIIKFWNVGATVFTLGVVPHLGVFRVSQYVSN